MPDPIGDYLALLRRSLAVHPRRRERIVVEIESHLRDAAERHGAIEALARLGDAGELARSFAPTLADRVWQQRDRTAAVALIVAMAACLPVAADLWRANDGDRDAVMYALFLAPSALAAALSAVLVVLRRPAGRRLVAPLAALVAITALVTLLNLPPVSGAFAGYVNAVRHGGDERACAGRQLAACAADHADEIRVNYTIGAIALTIVYAWAVAGWTPRRLTRRPDRRQLA